MSIIKEIEIDRFRSCRKVKLKSIEDFNCLSGKNNSGKSNILRAISLFFTGEIEPGMPFDISRDCNSQPKEKKEVIVSLRIVLGDSVSIQKTLKNIQYLIPRDCKIKKIYEISKTGAMAYKTKYFIDERELSIEEQHSVDTYLNLFNFRYITSDRTPKSVLEENLIELQSELKFRLSKKNSHLKVQNSIMDDLKLLVHTLFEPVSIELKEADDMINSVDITIPTELTELLNSATYMIESNDGGIFNEKDQGHGIQNMLLFTILYLVDKNYHRKFGWKIGTIWLIEEPETFLHYNLENQLAFYFQKIVRENLNRFQIILTSHSSVFPQYASSNFYIDKESDKKDRFWTTSNKLAVHDFILKLNKERITSINSLVTMYPTNNIVLVEGEIDEFILNKLVYKYNIKNVKIFAIQKYINDPEQRGCEVMFNFININYNLINLRSKYGIISLFDWDVEKAKINRLQKKINKPNMVIQLDKEKKNPLLDKTFRGIEMFYNTEVVEYVKSLNEGLISDRGDSLIKDRYFADSGRYKLVKHKLFKAIEEKNVEIEFTYLKEIVELLKNLAV